LDDNDIRRAGLLADQILVEIGEASELGLCLDIRGAVQVHFVSVEVGVEALGHGKIHADGFGRTKDDFLGDHGSLVEGGLAVQEEDIAVLQLTFHDIPYLGHERSRFMVLDILEEQTVSIESVSRPEGEQVCFFDDRDPFSLTQKEIAVHESRPLFSGCVLHVDPVLISEDGVNFSLLDPLTYLVPVVLVNTDGIAEDISDDVRHGDLVDGQSGVRANDAARRLVHPFAHEVVANEPLLSRESLFDAFQGTAVAHALTVARVVEQAPNAKF